MKLDLDSYPLDIYADPSSKALLKSVRAQLVSSQMGRKPIAESILSSFVRKSSGMGLLSLIDKVAIGMKGKQARKCLAKLVREQSARVSRKHLLLRDEAQTNLMATACVTDLLSSMESGSWDAGAKHLGKMVVGLFKLRNPMDVLWESVVEITEKYNDICQVYHIAFLLNAYKSNRATEDLVKRLITETVCKDADGSESFSSKKRPELFSDVRYKTLHDNLTKRLSALDAEAKRNEDLYETFIKWRKKQ